MSANTLLQLLTQALYVVVFLVVGVQYLLGPRRVLLDTTLFFGVSTAIVSLSWLTPALGVDAQFWRERLTSTLLMALPYLMVRLVDDFAEVPRPVVHVATAGLALAALSLWLISPPRPLPLNLVLVVYFVGLVLYAAYTFVREARRSRGVTLRRLQAAALGSVGLGLQIFFTGASLVAPSLAMPFSELSQAFSFLSGVGYFLGFAPPRTLRWAWQEPELRAFLGRIGRLARLSDLAATVIGLEEGIARSLGATEATIGLYDESNGMLRFQRKRRVENQPEFAAAFAAAPELTRFYRENETFEMRPDELISGRAFAEGRVFFTPNALRDDPKNAPLYQAYGAAAILAAPIATGGRRLGIVVAYAPREPIFAEDDLGLIQLLAEQAAIVLESRALADELARARAREESARYKEDFLSAAAHDLRTPLTTLVAQAQLLELRALRDPAAPADLAGVRRLLGEAQRLSSLVREFLDSSPDAWSRLVGEKEEVDLVQLVRDAIERNAARRLPISLEAAGPVVVAADRTRLTQVVNNLLENAVKYSPAGGEIKLAVWTEAGEAQLTVRDSGIGIPTADLPYVFQRFHRGTNVDDRRFAGLGLGLAIARAIVEGHGGRIRVESTSPSGTTIRVTLPLAKPAELPSVSS